VLIFLFLAPFAIAQRGGGSTNAIGTGPDSVNALQNQFFLLGITAEEKENRLEEQERPSEGVSKLDLKAPLGAKNEYAKGRSLLLRKDPNRAIAHFSKAIAIYPKFVAAHNALGSAYMDLNRNDEARGEFAQATLLDDHLPNLFSNLCHAELAVKNYPAAEQAIKRASSLSPLNLYLSTTLVYAQFLNQNYQDAIATAHQVHQGKHDGAATVHYFAAASWRELKNLPEMEGELKIFLAEEPKNPNAESARQLIAQFNSAGTHPDGSVISRKPSEAMVAAAREEQKQVAEAERMCVDCSDADVAPPPAAAVEPDSATPGAVAPTSRLDPERVRSGSSDWVLRKSVDEVALFFAATDHGKSVSDLTQQDVGIRDDHEAPAAVIGFRNQSELPLRLGLVIDTSESITGRFSFEQGAAADFLRKVLVSKDDLAFVVGFSNSVLLVQDFTADQGQIAHGIGELAPAGGTALWDAVAYASRKLSSRVESQPVAKILVVISDGNDNSSQTSLKQAIQAAMRGEVIVYTVSTSESSSDSLGPSAGDHALKVLSEQSGGSAFVPDSLSSLSRSLAELQQVIRSRYLISYKPARFRPDGRYRAIDIQAQKSGRKLRVYARKGYYSRVDGAAGEEN
jgi:VWFA-related protein